VKPLTDAEVARFECLYSETFDGLLDPERTSSTEPVQYLSIRLIQTYIYKHTDREGDHGSH
jgi:hypothetical protein